MDAIWLRSFRATSSLGKMTKVESRRDSSKETLGAKQSPADPPQTQCLTTHPAGVAQ